ncbi:MAG: DEAD/DEAH box helicase [Muribaculaceae bacterium]|nr:DEAD/DEAH box helicase [Muribaculaceae bacterium]
MQKKQIINNIKATGIEELNPMQLAVLSTEAQKLFLIAPTGSGKTLAFTIALLRQMQTPCGKLQGVVIAPARELVIQIADVIRSVSPGYKILPLYGGHPMSDEVSSIEGSMPDIAVATPGRLLDHITRGTLSLNDIRAMVMDEYDKSLELGFHGEMKKIVRAMPRKVSSVTLTSATLLTEMPDFIDMEGAVTIDYTTRTEAPRSRMRIVDVPSPERDKLTTLAELLATFSPDAPYIVFVNHRESAERVFNNLKKRGYPVGLYHGGLEQRDRELAIDLFNNGSTPWLVSTDLASRGLDIADVAAVVHYHLPLTEETWTHRNGRTARVKADGTIYVITAEGENIPDFISFDRQFYPPEITSAPEPSPVASLYFSAGKREKLSRGDILGFLIQKGGLTAEEIGKIIVKDHHALVAVPSARISEVMKKIKGEKIKNKSVKISRV